jgi:hypothetical protein
MGRRVCGCPITRRCFVCSIVLSGPVETAVFTAAVLLLLSDNWGKEVCGSTLYTFTTIYIYTFTIYIYIYIYVCMYLYIYTSIYAYISALF